MRLNKCVNVDAPGIRVGSDVNADDSKLPTNQTMATPTECAADAFSFWV